VRYFNLAYRRPFSIRMAMGVVRRLRVVAVELGLPMGDHTIQLALLILERCE
jgi:hypothetical protein